MAVVSLFVVVEGSPRLGPLPLLRIADPEIARDAISRALEKSQRLKRPSDELLRRVIDDQEEDLRCALAFVEGTAA